MNVSSIQGISSFTSSDAAERLTSIHNNSINGLEPSSPSEIGFGRFIKDFLQQSNSAQQAAEQSIEAFVSGKSDNIQDVAIAMANAEISFKYFLEIRNKVIESFNDLMRLQF